MKSSQTEKPQSAEATYRPGQLGWTPVMDRKERFDKLNAFVMSRNGWIVSVPGAETVTMECLPGSALPDELRDAGYTLEPAGEGERILPAAIVEELTLSASGIFEMATEGSTKAIVEVRTAAGLTRVERFTFAL